MANEEHWETSSGLNLDGATVTVLDCEFGFNANIGNGAVCANFRLQPNDGSDIIEQSFSVGGKFEANRDGSALEGNGKVNKNSNFGILIESIKDVVDQPGDVIGNPKLAESWAGLIFTFGTIEREVRNPSTGEMKMGTRFVVTEFHGSEGDTKRPAKAKAKAVPSKAAGPSSDIDPELWQQLLDVAREYEDHSDFVEVALDLDGVEGNKAAQKAIMTTKDGSVWAAK